MLVNWILGGVAALSLLLLLWQWLAARRFPLHQRVPVHSFPPALTLFKPVKGCETDTEACLRSWFTQDYTGRVQILFGVAAAEDPVCNIVRRLLEEFREVDAQLIVCAHLNGANAKIAKLVQLESLARHEIFVVSDADVRVSPDFLSNLVAPFGKPEVGLVNCFYQLANPGTTALRWEAVAINVDFWSQVLQSVSLKPMDFALGAVMATRRQCLAEIGGFAALADCLADDYQLGNRLARRGHRIALCPVVVECWSEPQTWAAVWKHQLRWARTIRVCQPLPYFFSILSNPTLWPLLWLILHPGTVALGLAAAALVVRSLTAMDLHRRLAQRRMRLRDLWLVPGKDLLQTAIWLLAFAGNRIEWRGRRMRLRKDGTLVEA